MARSLKRADESNDGNVVDPPAGLDAVLNGLETVVRELEGGELPLERALERFEEGIRLARQGSRMLDAVEERVETLLAERDEIVPLAPEAEGASADEDAR